MGAAVVDGLPTIVTGLCLADVCPNDLVVTLHGNSDGDCQSGSVRVRGSMPAHDVPSSRPASARARGESQRFDCAHACQSGQHVLRLLLPRLAVAQPLDGRDTRRVAEHNLEPVPGW